MLVAEMLDAVWDCVGDLAVQSNCRDEWPNIGRTFWEKGFCRAIETEFELRNNAVSEQSAVSLSRLKR